MENIKKYVGFSYFKNILNIKNIDTEFETYYSEYNKKNDDYNHYYTYNNSEILESALHNCIFLLKNFEKEFFLLNAYTLQEILEKIDITDFIENIQQKPNSEFLRKIGFLLEAYLGINIDVGEKFIIKKAYIDILNTEIFITYSGDKIKSKKFKIIDNSLGKTGGFNPLLIKKDIDSKIFSSDFNKNLENINNEFDAKIIEKAITYLYTKETKGSLEIEGEQFHQSKNRGFLKLISNIPIQKKLNKTDILKFYNTIYGDSLEDYRDIQNYIGSGNGMMGENIIEYIPTKNEDLEEHMGELIDFYLKNKDTLNPILLATVLSTQFVLIHPFVDGNGRTSRFLLQFSLLNSGIGMLGENKIILPVSAYILLNKDLYYKKLEGISGKLLDFIEYNEKENGEVEVLNSTTSVYRNIDFTHISNYFYEVLDGSINIDYKKELHYINDFYKIYSFIDENYNISSNNISFITKNIIQSDGKLSNTKIKALEKKGLTLEILKDIEEKLQTLC